MKSSPMSAFYLILSLIFSIFIVMKFDHIGTHVVHMPVEYGFFAKMIGFILTTILSYLGAIIGDYIRRLAIPDAIFVNGSLFSLLKEKFFWFIVPQLVGLFIGGALGASIVMNLFK